MSKSRILKSAGDACERTLPKGINGRALCRWCGVEVPKGRRTFCGDECVDNHLIRSQPAHAKRQVEKRDMGVCHLCGLDTKQVERLIEQAIPTRIEPWSWKNKAHAREQYKKDERIRRRNKSIQRDFRRWLGIPGHRNTLWDMDHTVPVSKGGGECGLDNLRTLCIWCHRKETKKLRNRKASK